MIYLAWRLVEALASYPKLVKLSLPRLCSDIQGFRSLAKYLLRGTLKDLEGRQACTIAGSFLILVILFPLVVDQVIFFVICKSFCLPLY
jgi:hypothetical protein